MQTLKRAGRFPNSVSDSGDDRGQAPDNNQQIKPVKNMKTTKLILTAIPLILSSLFATGCAQFMAIRQPRPFTPSSLVSGAKRTDIVAELGQPLTSEPRANQLTDVYHYVDGGQKNCAVSKTGRVLLYTAGDIFTAWLDQVIWIPAEAFGFPGTTHAVTVDYTRFDDGCWHAATIQDKIWQGRPSRSARANSAGIVGVVPVPVCTPAPANQTYVYSPPTLHYTGSGVGAIQAGLMNNLGRP
jgi:hypothetical protein